MDVRAKRESRKLEAVSSCPPVSLASSNRYESVSGAVHRRVSTLEILETIYFLDHASLSDIFSTANLLEID